VGVLVVVDVEVVESVGIDELEVVADDLAAL